MDKICCTFTIFYFVILISWFLDLDKPVINLTGFFCLYKNFLYLCLNLKMYNMTQTAAGAYRVQKWYNSEIFPLIPLITTKKANEYNTQGFTFRWLIFTLWSLDTFQFEISFNIDTHWGIGLTFLLPYLRGVIAIPCPYKIGIFIDKYLSRRP